MKTALLAILLGWAVSALATPPPGYTTEVFAAKLNNWNWLGISNSVSGPLQNANTYPVGQGYPTQFISTMPDGENFGSNQSNGGGGSPFTPYGGANSPMWQWYATMAISASQDSSGTWHSGMISSMDSQGNGFVTPPVPYYVEAVMNCPPIPGGYWPGGTANYVPEGQWISFWLLGRNNVFRDSNQVPEVDVCELYGKNPVLNQETVHVWGPGGSPAVSSTANYLAMPVPGQGGPGGWTGTHTYGCLVTAQTITMYVDNAVVWSTPTPAAELEPMFLMVDFSLGGGYPITIPSGTTIYLDSLTCWTP